VVPPRYQYRSDILRSPVRLLLSVFRSWRNLGDSYELKLAELAIAHSRLGRRFARWHDVVETLRADARTAPRLAARRTSGPIDLDALRRLPSGSLGRTLADQCLANGLNPNLVQLVPKTDEDWVLAEFYQTHDIWHAVTGWQSDPVGEMGIAAFYVAQLRAPRWLALLVFLFFLKAVLFAPHTFDGRARAMATGYRMGQQALPLFGIDWSELWALPIDEVRKRLNVVPSEIQAETSSLLGPLR